MPNTFTAPPIHSWSRRLILRQHSLRRCLQSFIMKFGKVIDIALIPPCRFMPSILAHPGASALRKLAIKAFQQRRATADHTTDFARALRILNAIFIVRRRPRIDDREIPYDIFVDLFLWQLKEMGERKKNSDKMWQMRLINSLPRHRTSACSR